MFSVASDLK